MKKVAGFSFDQEPEAEETGKLVFTVDSQEKIHKIFAQFGLSAAKDVTLHVNYGILEEDEERLAFLRGAFLSGGSVTDPAKRYHLELTTSHYKVSRETCALLLDAGFSPKETTRGGNSILYFKQSNLIEDFLTAIGAPVCAMGVMEAKVEKDLRNGVNRRVNCETANLTKVVDASMEQVAAIRKLQKRGQLKDLPPTPRAGGRPPAFLSSLQSHISGSPFHVCRLLHQNCTFPSYAFLLVAKFSRFLYLFLLRKEK